MGHTGKTGPEPLNDRLSLLRAQAIRDRMVTLAPMLKTPLDRRVVFSVTACSQVR